MNAAEKTRITELARRAKRQPWRTHAIADGEVCLLDHLDSRCKATRLTKVGREARDFYFRLVADPAIAPAEFVKCDYCDRPLEEGRQNCCKNCAVSRE